ncbi:Ig-like domain-containing protein [uncultured Gemmiger sp.]|uniref:Ig-like domain-containing protein n=1 Tax=uncultured Gemmiger sp. TaxID=1623490 RepID=UPI0025CFE7F2|nr:Ig-like domain-containing protein [uncultured Gemmiger sp.]
MKKKFAWIAVIAMVLSLVGCGVDITSVSLPTDIVMEKGVTQQLEIEYGTKADAEQEKIAEAASKLNLTWTSSDEEVATVDETGLVTAVGAGEADITVSVSDANISSTTHVKVVITPTGVEAPDSIELVTNGENSKALGAKMTPEDATEVKLAYESSDESVATVDENGVVTAVADGECVITTYVTADIPATAESAEAKPVVDEVVSSEAEVADSAADSETPDDAVASEPEDTTDIDSSFGVVPDGLSAETKVTVTTKVEQITLNKTEGILTVGNSVTVTATVTPDNATNATVNWTSSDETVATVDSNGKVTAVAAGSATITATSESDGDVSADYALTVNKAAAKPATNYSGTGSSAGAATTPSYTAPSTPSASTPTYVPEPAPAPAPDPAPAPAEPSQPSGGDIVPGSTEDYDNRYKDFGQWSGTDWTQDSSCGTNQTEGD